MRWGFRARLTLWHGVTTAVVLAIIGLAADQLLARSIFAQLDEALLSIAETEAGSSLDGTSGIHLHDVDALVGSGGQRLARLDKFVQIIDGHGAVLLRSRSLGATTLPVSATLAERVRRGERVIETSATSDGEPIRVLTLPVSVAAEHPYAVQVATSLRPTYGFLRTVRFLLLAASIAILAAVAITGALLARSALKPVATTVATARDIGDAIDGRRLASAGSDDEIGQLNATLNQMLDRLERSMEVHRRFTADASHELRTPLSRLRAQLEIALRQPRTTAEYREVIQSSLEEAVRMTDLTVALLTLAHLDGGQHGWTPGSPAGVVGDALEAARAGLAAEADERQIGIAIAPAPHIAVRVPPGMLALLVGNLLQNAVKFSPPGGRVVARGAVANGHAVLSVEDEGPGIPVEQVPRVFDRFYRGEEARSGASAGFGLGLSICRAIVQRYDGAIEIARNADRGSAFVVRLPLDDARPGSRA